MKVAVTGGAGRLGHKVVAELLEAGHQVVSLDIINPASDQGCPFVRVDLTDFGQTVGALTAVDKRHSGVNAVVHLAAIPGPGRAPNAALFANNIQTTYNVFETARLARIHNVVFASSETVHGAPYQSLPIDESSQLQATTTYGMEKLLEERMAYQFTNWEPLMKIVALRIGLITHQEYYADFDKFDAASHAPSLWNYVDARDVAQAVRLALEYEKVGFDAFIISAADTLMPQETRELLRSTYPDVKLRFETIGRQSLFVSDKAKRVLGYNPRYSWRD